MRKPFVNLCFEFSIFFFFEILISLTGDQKNLVLFFASVPFFQCSIEIPSTHLTIHCTSKNIIKKTPGFFLVPGWRF